MNASTIRLALAMGTLTLGVASPLLAEGPHSVTANIGVVSNYVWRGQTQTDGQAAVQGGLDYAHDSGFYAGTWVSNVDFGDDTSYELDAYLGFGGSFTDDLSYDLGLMYIAYPDSRDLDFAELSASATWKWLTAGVAYTFYGQADDADGVDNGEALYIEGDLYYFTSVDVELPMDLALSIRGGYYDFDYNEGGNDYAHWGASISRDAGDFGTFSFNYDQITRDTYDDDPTLWVGWNKEF